jgi:hypothetical protein
MHRQALRLGLLTLVFLTLGLPGVARAQDTPPPLTSGSLPTNSSSPLDARFGGTRTTFEQTYGEPSKADAGDYPRGDDYRIDGFKRVSVFYRSSKIIHLTLSAPTNDFWSTKQADSAVADFLPTDAKLGTPVTNTDNEPVVRVRSKALAASIKQAVYDEFDASGKPGDLSITYQLDKQGRVKAIDVELGRVAAATAQGSGGTDGDQAYLKALRQQFDPLAASMDEFDRALQGLSSGTVDAQTAGQTFVNDWNVWRQAAADATSLAPTTAQQDTQDLYLKLTGLLSSAADDYQNGLLNSDSSLLSSGDTSYGQARILRVVIDSILAKAGV